MAKKETAPEPVKPDVAKDRPVGDKPVDKTEELVTDGAKRAKAQWDKETKGKRSQITIPGSTDSVEIAQLTYEGNKVSVWTTSDTTLPPDFVIVNPPTKVFIDKDNIVENPLGVIAHAINGATK